MVVGVPQALQAMVTVAGFWAKHVYCSSCCVLCASLVTAGPALPLDQKQVDSLRWVLTKFRPATHRCPFISFRKWRVHGRMYLTCIIGK